jgi:hypothetical protein
MHVPDVNARRTGCVGGPHIAAGTDTQCVYCEVERLRSQVRMWEERFDRWQDWRISEAALSSSRDQTGTKNAS